MTLEEKLQLAESYLRTLKIAVLEGETPACLTWQSHSGVLVKIMDIRGVEALEEAVDLAKGLLQVRKALVPKEAPNG